MILLYNLFLLLYRAGIYFASPWNRKAKLWIEGRKKNFETLEDYFLSVPADKNRVWMHCASLGEFEQGKPVLKKISALYPDVLIVITFFSPSGYEIAKKDKDFKKVFYLPVDSKIHAKKFIDIVKPSIVFWIKYEYWFYYLQELKTRNIPVLLISGVFVKSQPFFKWYGSLWQKMLTSFTYFFVQNKNSATVLKQLVEENKIEVSGDTRCDRVINIAMDFIEVPSIAEFCSDNITIVAGSTWEDDEAEWTHFVKQHPEIKFIIAPHEIDDENLHDVKKEFPGSIFYSEWIKLQEDNGNAQPKIHCMIIDNIGMLSRLYKYATITYVGGGFGYNGLHNILEAAVYGKPVIFGPEYEKNFEAEELIEAGGAVSIDNALELEKVVNKLLNNKSEYEMSCKAARDYVYANAGASEKIISFVQKKRLFTN